MARESHRRMFDDGRMVPAMPPPPFITKSAFTSQQGRLRYGVSDGVDTQHGTSICPALPLDPSRLTAFYALRGRDFEA
eukprot:scaffold3665_cov244-Pinguiococcus_pyrenoidosus.AAC.3